MALGKTKIWGKIIGKDKKGFILVIEGREYTGSGFTIEIQKREFIGSVSGIKKVLEGENEAVAFTEKI